MRWFAVVQPDVCLIRDPNKLEALGVMAAPELVIEIIYPGNLKRK
jgi:Uma2 family endonuclease